MNFDWNKVTAEELMEAMKRMTPDSEFRCRLSVNEETFIPELEVRFAMNLTKEETD